MNTMSGEGAGAPSTSTRKTVVHCSSCRESEGRLDTDQALVRLERNDPSLTSCRVVSGFYWRGVSTNAVYLRPRDGKDWRRLGHALASNTHVRKLELIDLAKLNPSDGSSRHPDVDQWLRSFYRKLGNNRSIRRLGLRNVDLYEGKIFTPQCLLLLLEKNPNLTSLAFAKYNLGECQWASERLSTAISNMVGPLETLDLSDAKITTNMCQSLVAALHAHSPTLRFLEMIGNDIRCGGCVAIADLMRNQNSALVKLYLDNNSIGDEGVEALADGLAISKHLKALTLHANPAVTSRGFSAVQRALCNGPGIDDIVRSHHTLQQLGAKADRLPEELKLALSLNRAANKSHVARRKVVMHNFFYNCNVELLDEIPWSFLPDVLAVVADDDSNQQIKVATNRDLRHLALFRILRRCPSICKVHAQGRAGGGGEQMLAIKRMRLS